MSRFLLNDLKTYILSYLSKQYVHFFRFVQTKRYTYNESFSRSRLYNASIGSVNGDVYYLGIGNNGTYDYATLLREGVDKVEN